MPAPSRIAGTKGPPFTPGRRPVKPASGGSGGGAFGLTLSEVRGVCVAFDSATLSETPLWTRLDDPAGPFKVTSWEIDRGRSYELDKTAAGTATFTMVDTTGQFDPTNASSFFNGKLNPLKQAAIGLQNPVTGGWSTLYRGFVDEWDYELDLTGRFLFVTVRLVDAFDLLAASEVAPGEFGQAVPGGSEGDVFYGDDQEVDDRIRLALDDADWPTGLRSIFSGNVAVRGTVYAPRTQVLTILQDAADAEFPGVANIFVSREGKVSFRGRHARFNPTNPQYEIDTWSCGDKTAADLNPTTVAVISPLRFNRGKTNLINSALATPQEIADNDIAGQLATDTTSAGTYGRRSVSFENLLTLEHLANGNNALEETRLFANYYRDNYKDPRTRIKQVVFKPQNAAGTYGQASWALLCGVEIGDRLHVKTTHPGGGGFNEHFYIEGIHYSATPMRAAHPYVELALDVSPAAYYTTNPFS